MNEENMDMNSVFSISCVKAIQEAFKFAQENRFEYLTVDNLMLFVAKTENGRKFFEAMGLNISNYEKEIVNYLHDNIPKISHNAHPQSSVSLDKLLETAIILRKSSSREALVDEPYLFVSLFELNKSEIATLAYLYEHNISRFDIMNYISHKKTKNAKTKTSANQPAQKGDKGDKDQSPLEKYAVNLNEKVKNGLIDEMIGNDDEVSKMVQILAQRRKNNPIIVGDPGVGKTALVEGLTHRIVNQKVPVQLKDFTVYALDMAALLAGTKYRGDFEERLKDVINQASEDHNIVLFVDEIHTLVGAGASNGAMDASNILKPALANGSIKVIGATTFDEHKKIFEKDGGLSRRFQKIVVNEPTQDVCVKILQGIKQHYEKFHNVSYDNSALEAAVQLTAKYINDRKLPDKAIDVIDMAGAIMKLSSEKHVIGSNDVAQVVAKMAKIPVDSINSQEKDKLINLEPNLRKEIYGQNDAIDKVIDSIFLSRLNLMNKPKPIGSYLFAGPSGVGKTELCKVLSKTLDIPLIRFDMSEYMEKHSVARLIGAPPGYVGYDEGGQLTEAIRKTPHCVLLLDEIEKANPDIYNILLQVMDYGMLTDNNGRKADFKNVILVMTTNVGAQVMAKKSMGFNSANNEKEVKQDRETTIKKAFSPEFYNRLDSVVQFNSLTKENILQVVEKQLKKLEAQLVDKKVIAFFTDALKEHIVAQGNDPQYGARPIERFVEQNITKKFARLILVGDLSEGGEVQVDVKDGEIVLNIICSYSNSDANTKPIISSETIQLLETVLPEKKKTRSKKSPE